MKCESCNPRCGAWQYCTERLTSQRGFVANTSTHTTTTCESNEERSGYKLTFTPEYYEGTNSQRQEIMMGTSKTVKPMNWDTSTRLRIKEGYVHAGTLGYFVGWSDTDENMVIWSESQHPMSITAPILIEALEMAPLTKEEAIREFMQEWENFVRKTELDGTANDNDDEAFIYALLEEFGERVYNRRFKEGEFRVY